MCTSKIMFTRFRFKSDNSNFKSVNLCVVEVRMRIVGKSTADLWIISYHVKWEFHDIISVFSNDHNLVRLLWILLMKRACVYKEYCIWNLTLSSTLFASFGVINNKCKLDVFSCCLLGNPYRAFLQKMSTTIPKAKHFFVSKCCYQSVLLSYSVLLCQDTLFWMLQE